MFLAVQCQPCEMSNSIFNYNDYSATFLAMISPVGLCSTLVTTPPFPAPSSSNFSKSSVLRFSILRFSARNVIRRSRCSSSISNSLSFFVTESTLLGAPDGSTTLQTSKQITSGHKLQGGLRRPAQTKTASVVHKPLTYFSGIDTGGARIVNFGFAFPFLPPSMFYFGRRALHYGK